MPTSEARAYTPAPIDPGGFNPDADIPYGLTTAHVRAAMEEFVDFLGIVNGALHRKRLPRLETMMMPANFSSMVSDFVTTAIPKHCTGLVRNLYHNGYPDLIPANSFPGDSAQYADRGVEVKGSRYDSGWQGHNEEDCWLMVLVFRSNRPGDAVKGVGPVPFGFEAVYLAQLTKADWKFGGRAGRSRRTITAAVTAAGCRRMKENWVYRAPAVSRPRRTGSGVR
ncbi:MAG: hypothetical protein K2X87_25615 [Gemmataceae bacterium]|nr:hypothetical protein [Gemmataceae bacterium]